MHLRGILLAFALGLGLTACSTASNDSATTSSTATTTATTAKTAKTFSVSTPSGQVSVSLDGTLPPSWPTSFPVPSDATVAGSGSLGGSSSTTMVGVYSTGAAPQAAFSHYTSSAGLTTSDARTLGAGSAYVGTANITAPYTGSITVISWSSRTYIVVVIEGSAT